ncbi:hypothetical protein SAMN05443246_2016 [Paenibacillus sp. GP183]|jgi:hypothetical protein|nr:hypothetical protein SAMN05443246_2016 [Paenibacillus sp. GP183]
MNLGDRMLRIIYENYRGFKITKQGSTYFAIHKEARFSHLRLSELLNTIDSYIEKNLTPEE